MSLDDNTVKNDDTAATTEGQEVTATPVSETTPTSSQPEASTEQASDSPASSAEESPKPEETASTPTPTAEAPAGEEPAKEKKLQLNPTIGATEPKAVGSIPESEITGQSAQSAPEQGPIDIPGMETLDSELESQLSAALEGSTPAAHPAGEAVAESAGMPKDPNELEPGARLKGRVDAIDDEQLLVDIGYRATGILSRRHYEGKELPALHAEIDVVVDKVDEAEGAIHLVLPRSARKAGGDWSALSVGQVVECMVEKTNKGGLSVMVSQIRGFMPAGQVDLHFIGDLEPFVGQKLTAKIIDLNPKKRNLVLSRKAILQEERAEVEKQIWETLAVGEQRKGIVKSIMDYGAFVDIGGIDGLVHVRELSWTRVNHPSDVLSQGQEVDVKVLSIDPEKKKISLGMKQLLANPWDYAEEKYPQSSMVSGIVKKTTDFGAFVEVEPGLEGLIHISELDYKRVNHVTEVVSVGQTVEAKVIEVNKNKRRMSLSIKANKPKPQLSPEQVAKREKEAAEIKKIREDAAKRRETLKGGKGTDTSGGLFGNPNDFK